MIKPRTNPKHEIRNPKQTQMLQHQNSNRRTPKLFRTFGFRILDLFRISCLGFRISPKGLSRISPKGVGSSFVLRISCFSLVVIIGLMGLVAHETTPAQQAPTASVWDGVYTEEQAKRGQVLYNQECASCHLATLTGGEMATPLVGAEFAANWDGLTVGELFERIRVTMPPDQPERVGRQQKADILAYMLSVNRFPAGKRELARDTHLLNQIRLEMTKP
jgi:mono/diheme cytochrome c family protein